MHTNRKKIWVLFWSICLVKLLLISFIASPSIFSDEYLYAKLAQSIQEEGSLKIHGEKINAYPPLYPIMLSLAMFFGSMTTVFFVMKLLNVLISTAIIFPTFFLAKEVMDKKQAGWVAATVAVIPMSFAFSGFVMSENLFYTLFMFTIFSMYKSFTQSDTKWQVITGICIGALFLTKFMGIIVVPLYIIASSLIHRKQHKHWIKAVFQKGWKVGLAAGIVAGIWLLRNILTFGLSSVAMFGSYSRELSVATRTENIWIISFIIWTIIYLGMIFIASGIILPAAARKVKDHFVLTTIVYTAILLIIITTANHAATASLKGLASFLPGRPIGRYSDTVLPLIIILGYLGLTKCVKNDKDIKKTLIWTTIPLLIAGIGLTLFTILLANNLALTWLGILGYLAPLWTAKVAITLLAILGLLAVLYLINQKKGYNEKAIKGALLAFFILTSLISYGINIVNAQDWNESEQTELGKWIAENIPKEKSILIDKASCQDASIRETGNLCNKKGDTTLVGFWIKNKITIATEGEADYIITTLEKELELVKETEHFKVYRNDGN